MQESLLRGVSSEAVQYAAQRKLLTVILYDMEQYCAQEIAIRNMPFTAVR